MSDDLLDIGDRVVGHGRRPASRSRPSWSRGRDTEIKVYEGEIESLSSAQSQGVGIRVIADGRQGFAYAGTFDDDVLAETLAEARDNAGFATPDEFLGLAEPDGVAVAELDLFREALGRLPHRRARSSWPSSSSGRCAPPTPASRASSRPSTSTSWPRAPSSPPPASAPPAARPACYVVDLRHGRRGRRDPDRLRVLGRPRARASSTWPRAAADAAERATRMLGAVKPAERAAHRRARPVGHRPVPRHPRPSRSTARRCSRAGRCSPIASARRWPRRSSPWSTTRPTRGPSPPPRPTARAWPPAATCSSTGGVLAAVRAQRLHAPAGPARAPPAPRCAAGSRARPASGAWPRRCCPGTATPGRAGRRRRRRACSCRTSPGCTRA